ncbi:extracellular proline-serine rich protein [Diaporthe eres]|uniref:Yeast cell wall synthesis Kre9/Knh1-like N-terminal domain-containing protein n=1 Tax=Diaporthe vaccinii TaxID=105482 RepID=A0ABR4E161_9PEZI|nr:extracellular proline-serine rich protein [Diaporthe eres]
MVRSVFSPFLVIAIAILSSLAQAIRFSYPTSADNAHIADISIVKGDTLNVIWDTVSTDPKNFSLYLWEFAAHPPAYELVAYNVDMEANQATFKVPCNIKSSPDWQLTMTEGINVYASMHRLLALRSRTAMAVVLPCHLIHKSAPPHRPTMLRT